MDDVLCNTLASADEELNGFSFLLFLIIFFYHQALTPMTLRSPVSPAPGAEISEGELG